MKNSSAANRVDLRHILRALSSRNYRLFFIGQMISLTGTWMQYLAMGWLVYRLTNSVFALGVIGFASQIIVLFISPFAGVWADRMNRRRILVLTQTFAMVQAFVLTALVMTRTVQVWHIIALSVFLGLVNSFDMPVRQSFTMEMIDNKEDLGNAIALNSLIFNSARFFGPTVAGLVVAWWGEGVCFLANGISYIAVIAALVAMDVAPPERGNNHPHILESMKEGFLYTFGSRPMRLALLLMSLVSFVVMPYAVLLPAFAKDTLQGTSLTLGFLMGATGVGALAGAVFLAARKEVAGLGRIMSAATFLFGAGLIALSFAHSVWFSLILMVVIGFGLMVEMAATNTVLQTLVDDDKRGRVMSFYVVAFTGLTPVGSLLAGALASHISTPLTILLAGICCVAGAAVFTTRLRVLNVALDKT